MAKEQTIVFHIPPNCAVFISLYQVEMTSAALILISSIRSWTPYSSGKSRRHDWGVVVGHVFFLIMKNYEFMASSLPPPIPTFCCSRARYLGQQGRKNLPGREDLRILKPSVNNIGMILSWELTKKSGKIPACKIKICIITKAIPNKAN